MFMYFKRSLCDRILYYVFLLHKYLIKNRNISLVIMCDDYIYDKWHDVLGLYFDEVIKIEAEAIRNNRIL